MKKRANRLIFYKCVANFLFPTCLMLIIAIVSSAVLNELLEDTMIVRYIVFSMSALIVVASTLVVVRANEPMQYLKPSRVYSNATGLALIGFLLWEKRFIPYLLNPVILGILIVVALLSSFYQKRFKKLIVNEILEDNLNTDFDYLAEDMKQTSKMLEEQMSDLLKDKYKDTFLIKTTNYAKNVQTQLTEFSLGFLTKKAHKILFELIVSLDMD